MKTKEELNALKNGAEAVNKKLHELSASELEQVTGGNDPADVQPDFACKSSQIHEIFNDD